MITATIPAEFEPFIAHQLATGRYHRDRPLSSRQAAIIPPKRLCPMPCDCSASKGWKHYDRKFRWALTNSTVAKKS
jgi:hypothetical protein